MVSQEQLFLRVKSYLLPVVYHIRGNFPTRSDIPVGPVFEQYTYSTNMMRTEHPNVVFSYKPVDDSSAWGCLLLFPPWIIFSTSSLTE